MPDGNEPAFQPLPATPFRGNRITQRSIYLPATIPEVTADCDKPHELWRAILRALYGQGFYDRAAHGLGISARYVKAMCYGSRLVPTSLASLLRYRSEERYHKRLREISELEREFAQIIAAERALARWARDVHVPRLYELVVLQGRRMTLMAERRAARAAAKAAAAASEARRRGGG